MSEVLTPTTATEAHSGTHEHHCATMNQVPASVSGQSPLHHTNMTPRPSLRDGQAGVFFCEKPLLGHLTLRGQQNNASFMRGCENVLGVTLPTQALTSAENGDLSVRWVGPDEWLVVLPNERAFTVEESLRKQIEGHYSVVNVSGGQTVFELSGPDALRVMQKSTPVDLHLDAFPVGKAVSTLFAKSTALIRRTGEDQFELVVRRSFSDYLWRWIQAASQEYGLVVRT